MYIVGMIIAIILGAIAGRVDGGGILKIPEIVERFIIMIFFTIACVPFAGWWSLLALTGMVGIATGHGQYFLDRLLRGSKETKERLDVVVSVFFGADWRSKYTLKHKFTPSEIKEYTTSIKPKLYLRNVFGMFVTGFLVGLPAAILASVFGHYLIAVVLLQTGTVKALSYIIGYEVFKNTESAEYLNGGLRNVLCVIALVLFYYY